MTGRGGGVRQRALLAAHHREAARGPGRERQPRRPHRGRERRERAEEQQRDAELHAAPADLHFHPVEPLERRAHADEAAAQPRVRDERQQRPAQAGIAHQRGAGDRQPARATSATRRCHAREMRPSARTASGRRAVSRISTSAWPAVSTSMSTIAAP